MAALALPATPAPRQQTARLISNFNDLSPVAGGAMARMTRLGSKWAVDVDMPPMTYAQAMAWIAALTLEAGTVSMPLYQPGFEPGAPGTVLVNGAGQSGSTLTVDGFAANYALKAGQFVSIATGGRSYLHVVAEDAAPAVGQSLTAIPLRPMLRAPPADNAPVAVKSPMVEGFVQARERAFTVDVARHVGLSFTIIEVR